MSDDGIVLRGLVKRFGARTALKGIDLTIAGRQILGVVGPDGAGKTTLLRSLAGLLVVQATEAHVLGHDLLGDVTALKARIGYVPQSFSLFPDLTVGENLRFTARLHRLTRATFTARATPILEATALAPFVGRRAGALSGGMKHKLAIANALLPEPGLIILDEPTAGVDVTSRQEIWTMLEHARAGALVIISTSYLDEAASCDRLVYLHDGRVAATGTPEALRAATPLELYRAWGDPGREIARRVRTLPYVQAARPAGPYVRIEVRRDESPGFHRVVADLAALPDGLVRLAEPAPVDMESTLLALSLGGT